MHHHDHSDTASVVVGAVSSLGLGKLFGIISYDDLLSAFILGAAGSLGGWLIKTMIGYSKNLINKL